MCADGRYIYVSLILGQIIDRYTCISSSTEFSFSRLLFFIFVSAENPCSRRYEVENGKKILSDFINISGYSET